MNIKELSQEELSDMSHSDVAFYVLEEKKEAMKIIDLFNKVTKLIGLNEAEKDDLIADFYTMISTDKRFVALDGGLVDLKKRHSIQNIKVDHNDLDSDDLIEIEDIDPEEEEEELSSLDDNEDDAIEDDDYKDLVTVSEDEIA